MCFEACFEWGAPLVRLMVAHGSALLMEADEAVGEVEAGVVVEEIAQGVVVLFGAEGEAADDGMDGLRGAVAEQCGECVADGIQFPLHEA